MYRKRWDLLHIASTVWYFFTEKIRLFGFYCRILSISWIPIYINVFLILAWYLQGYYWLSTSKRLVTYPCVDLTYWIVIKGPYKSLIANRSYGGFVIGYAMISLALTNYAGSHRLISNHNRGWICALQILNSYQISYQNLLVMYQIV